jgi:hypothetical protein
MTAYLHDAFSYATGFKVVSLLLLMAVLLAIRLPRCALPPPEKQS